MGKAVEGGRSGQRGGGVHSRALLLYFVTPGTHAQSLEQIGKDIK